MSKECLKSSWKNNNEKGLKNTVLSESCKVAEAALR